MEEQDNYGVYEDPHRGAQKKKNKFKGKQTFIRVILTLVLAYLIFLIASVQWNLYKTNQKLSDLQDELARLQREHLELLEFKEYVGSEEYIEYRARKELGLIKEGERVIVLTDPSEENGN